MEEDSLVKDLNYPSKTVPDASDESFALLKMLTGGGGGGHSETKEIDNNSYNNILLMESPYRCDICGKAVFPSKEMTVQPFCDCKKAYRYHAACLKGTAFFSDAFVSKGCVSCFVEKCRKETEHSKKVADRQLRQAMVVPVVTTDMKAKFLELLGEAGYEKGLFHPITRLFTSVDSDAVSRDFTIATQDEYLYTIFRDRGIDYDLCCEKGFTIPLLLALCPNIESKTKFFLARLGISKAKSLDFIRYAPLVYEIGITPLALRFFGFTIDQLISMNPSAKELISAGFHVGALFATGFTKKHLAAFPRIAITEFIEILGFSYDNLLLLEINSQDFSSGGVLSQVNKAVLAAALKIEINSVDGVRLGICTFAKEPSHSRPKRLINGIPVPE
jgi:hypothetical protein